MARPVLASSVVETRLGRWLLAVSGRGLAVASPVAPDANEAQARADVGARLGIALVGDQTPVLRRAAKQLDAYLGGRRESFKLPLDLQGTPFQRRTWEALLHIPYGHTITYAELARRIGRPKATRAVANACGRNPVAVVVPCHRVIASDGGLGGYAGGVALKRRLLSLERGSADDLPLFEVAIEGEEAQEAARTAEAALADLPHRLRAWLEDRTPIAQRAMDPGRWSAEVLELTEPNVWPGLIRRLAGEPGRSNAAHRSAAARELMEGALAHPQTPRKALDLDHLLHGAVALEGEAEDGAKLLEQVVQWATGPPALRAKERTALTEFLQAIMAGRLEADEGLRLRTVDLWLQAGIADTSSSWAAPIVDDPSLVYAAAGLWSEAAMVAEDRLARGQGDALELRRRLVEIYERLGDHDAMQSHLITLVLETRDPRYQAQLRALEDRHRSDS